jgi:penicillin-binding protein 1A
MEIRAQKAAECAVRNAGLRKSQVAIVAMHIDGRVVAMVGGNNYAASPFNRATQARRQPGSAFKLFVYLAALRSGRYTPDTMVDDSPVSFGGWSPENHNGKYAGRITLRQAFARSSNVVAARLTRELGVAAVTKAARDLGISTPIGNDAAIALGTSTGSLLELTAAYASIAQGLYPVRPTGLTDDGSDWLSRTLGAPSTFRQSELSGMRSLLASVVESGTGTGARLSIPAFGKTGTTQDNRDALFVGYAGDLVVGVWVGNDDNSPSPGLSGSGLPVRVWHDFMVNALDLPAAPPPEPADNASDNESVGLDDMPDFIRQALGDGTVETETDIDTDGDQQRDGPIPDAPRRRDDATEPQGPRIDTRVDRPPPRPRPAEDD